MIEILFDTDPTRGDLSRAGFTLLAFTLMLAACSVQPGSQPQDPDAPAVARSGIRFIDPPSGSGAMAPSLTTGQDGALLSWLEPTASGHTLYFAEFAGESWSAPLQIASGEAFFANWADLPQLVVSAEGTHFAHWLQKLGEDTYAYGASLARSRDGGESWQQLGLLHDDATPAEHGFVSYAPLASGGVQAFWLDGRLMPGGGDMQLRTSWLGEGAVEASTLLDDRVCECCATDAATTSAGPVVVYRDRSSTEIRDIALIRATSDGWSKPVVIHQDGWQIQGCPVNGPAIAAQGNRVAVAWFSAAGEQPTVKLAFSSDAGAHFAAPISVDDTKPMGRVDVILDQRGLAVVSWMGPTSGGAEIRWRQIAIDGERGAVQIVAATTAARSAGVSKMAPWGDGMLFAWVEDGKPSRLRTGLVGLR